MTGIIIKAYNGYYYVKEGNKLIACKLRGRLKKNRFSLGVGDKVDYTILEDDNGIIEEILPRTTLLERPLVANVDQVILTFAAINPNINFNLLDKFLILAEKSALDIIICINKVDLVDTAQLQQKLSVYYNIGYNIIMVSAESCYNIEKLRANLKNKISVFAGPSGVGKSSILNAISPTLKLTTGGLSEKIARGKHTTRYAELLTLDENSFVVDTPGFSFTEFEHILETELPYYFPEFTQFIGQCKFNTCIHDKEPNCAIKKAVEEKIITIDRYNSYLQILSEILKAKKVY